MLENTEADQAREDVLTERYASADLALKLVSERRPDTYMAEIVQLADYLERGWVDSTEEITEHFDVELQGGEPELRARLARLIEPYLAVGYEDGSIEKEARAEICRRVREVLDAGEGAQLIESNGGRPQPSLLDILAEAFGADEKKADEKAEPRRSFLDVIAGGPDQMGGQYVPEGTQLGFGPAITDREMQAARLKHETNERAAAELAELRRDLAETVDAWRSEANDPHQHESAEFNKGSLAAAADLELVLQGKARRDVAKAQRAEKLKRAVIDSSGFGPVPSETPAYFVFNEAKLYSIVGRERAAEQVAELLLPGVEVASVIVAWGTREGRGGLTAGEIRFTFEVAE